MLHSSPSPCSNISFPPPRGNFHAWTLSTTVSGCFSGNLLLVWVQDWTMEKWCNNYFMAFILRLPVALSDVTAKEDSGGYKSAWSFSREHSLSIKLPQAPKAGRKGQFMRSGKLSALNKQHKLCLQHLCFPRQEEFIAKWFRRKFNLFMFQVLKVSFVCLQLQNWWNFQLVNIGNVKTWEISLLQVFKKVFLVIDEKFLEGKLHKSLNDVSSWNLCRSFRNPLDAVFSNFIHFKHLIAGNSRSTSITDAWNCRQFEKKHKNCISISTHPSTCRKCSRKHIKSTTKIHRANSSR